MVAEEVLVRRLLTPRQTLDVLGQLSTQHILHGFLGAHPPRIWSELRLGGDRFILELRKDGPLARTPRGRFSNFWAAG